MTTSRHIAKSLTLGAAYGMGTDHLQAASRIYRAAKKCEPITPRQQEVYEQARDGELMPVGANRKWRRRTGLKVDWRVMHRAEKARDGSPRDVTEHIIALEKKGWLVVNLKGNAKPSLRLPAEVQFDHEVYGGAQWVKFEDIEMRAIYGVDHARKPQNHSLDAMAYGMHTMRWPQYPVPAPNDLVKDVYVEFAKTMADQIDQDVLHKLLEGLKK